jgi:hypothetical protein
MYNKRLRMDLNGIFLVYMIIRLLWVYFIDGAKIIIKIILQYLFKYFLFVHYLDY